jgi:hypothetical protein
MAQAKRALKGKRPSKAISMLGIVGVSLAASSGGSVADTPSRNTVPLQRITLGEEEITDVSLATFHFCDDENLGTLRSGMRLAAGCAACGACRGCAACSGGERTWSKPPRGQKNDGRRSNRRRSAACFGAELSSAHLGPGCRPNARGSSP